MTLSAKIIASSLLFTVTMSLNSFSQQSYTAAAAAEPAYVKNNMPAEADHTTTAALSATPETEASFSALFPNASNLVWGAGANNYWVSFLNDGRKANASITSKGKMNYIITECTMQHLPEAFSKIIAKTYAGYSLFNAIEIKAYGAVAHQAVLENNSSFITLKYTADGVEKLQQLKKQ